MSDPIEDLAYVKRIVDATQRALVADARPLLAWGFLSLAGVGLVYLVPPLDSIWLWVALIGSAWCYTGIRAFSRSRDSVACGFSQRVLARLWFGIFTAMTLIGFAGTFSGSLPPAAITPVFAALFGVGSLASAALLEGQRLAVLALGWWLGAIALFLIPPQWRLAVFGGLLTILLIAPAWSVQKSPYRP